jgi:hypothetical protein
MEPVQLGVGAGLSGTKESAKTTLNGKSNAAKPMQRPVS